ncbi:MAG: hypothetical protein ACJ72J_01060, partial [Nitrososphaeraceae archaeon]
MTSSSISRQQLLPLHIEADKIIILEESDKLYNTLVKELVCRIYLLYNILRHHYPHHLTYKDYLF